MYASINDSTYVEQTQTVVEALSHKHKMYATLPDLEAGSISTVSFMTSFLVVIDEPLLVFEPDNPTGVTDTADTVTDNLDGTWTVGFTIDKFLSVPTAVYRNPDLAGMPALSVQANDDVNRIVMMDETLVFVSATDVQFVGTSARAGMLAIGDEITITDGVTPTPVILTSVTESGTEPAINYTCDYATALVATGDTLILSRALPVPALSSVRTNGTVAENGADVIIQYATTVNGGELWNFISRKFIASLGFTISEPFIMDYTENIVVP